MLAALFTTILATSTTELVIYQTDLKRCRILRLSSDRRSRTLANFKHTEEMNRNWYQVVLAQDRSRVGWFQYQQRPKGVGDALGSYSVPVQGGTVTTHIFPIRDQYQVIGGFNRDNKISAITMNTEGEWSLANSRTTAKLEDEPADSQVAAPHWCGVIWMPNDDDNRIITSDPKLGVQVELRKAQGCFVQWFNRKEIRLKLPSGWIYSVAPANYPYVYASIEDPSYVGHNIRKPYIYQMNAKTGEALRLMEGTSVVVVTPGAPFRQP